MDPLHRELIQQAVDAARGGDRDKAFELLEQVLQEDEQNTTAWFLLARLTTNMDERRMALTTILQLEPDHQKARDMLDKMENKGTDADPDADVIPGVSRRLFRLIAAGVGGFIVLVVLIALVTINNSNQNKANQQREETRAALAATYPFLTATQAALDFTETAVAGTATQIALVSPTPSPQPTSNLPTLPPTPTHTPQPSATPTLAPLNLQGRIIGWGGPDFRNNGALPIQSRLLSGGGSFSELPLQEGQNPNVTLDGQIIVYSPYLTSQSEFSVSLVSVEGAQIPSPLDSASEFGGFITSHSPSMSRGATRIAFIGDKFSTGTAEIYVVVISGEAINESSIVQITNDGADYSYPAISPDGTQVVAVRTDEESQDLVIIDVVTQEMRQLTTNGFGAEETTPRWSPVGNLIAYAAKESTRPDFELYLTPPDRVDGGFLVGPAANEGSNEIYPVFSPQGSHLAFASDRDGSYNIYIADLNAQQLLKFTDDEDDEYPGSWVN